MSVPELFTMTITLKSGATVKMEVEDAEYVEDTLGRRKLRWTQPKAWRSKILHVDLDEVAAVVVARDGSRPF